jgi:hypothetical protein
MIISIWHFENLYFETLGTSCADTEQVSILKLADVLSYWTIKKSLGTESIGEKNDAYSHYLNLFDA